MQGKLFFFYRRYCKGYPEGYQVYRCSLAYAGFRKRVRAKTGAGFNGSLHCWNFHSESLDRGQGSSGSRNLRC